MLGTLLKGASAPLLLQYFASSSSGIGSGFLREWDKAGNVSGTTGPILNLPEVLVTKFDLILTLNSGNFTINETVTASNGATAQCRGWSGVLRRLTLETRAADNQRLFVAGQTVTGNSSNATGTISTNNSVVNAVAFSPSGDAVAFATGGNEASISVYEFDTSTGNLGSRFSAPATIPAGIAAYGVAFSPDGNTIAVSHSGSPYISVYPWSSTTGFGTKYANPATAMPAAIAQAVAFSPDGKVIAIASNASPYIVVYEWDSSTGFGAKLFNPVGIPSSAVTGVAFSPDGKALVVSYEGTPYIKGWRINTEVPVYVQNTVTTGNQVINPNGIFFKPDGTKMYILDESGTRGIDEYNLTTAWDISTKVFVQSVDISTITNSPEGIFFKPDGTKMFFSDETEEHIYEVTLTTAWDPSAWTGLAVSPRLDDPLGLFFKPDGTSVFVVAPRSPGDPVYEYTLSTAWDVTSINSTPNKTFFPSNPLIRNIALSTDGTKMYVATEDTTVLYYELSTAWDISSAAASYSFNHGDHQNSGRGIFFKPDGTKMFILGTLADTVTEYNLTTEWFVSSIKFGNAYTAPVTVPAGAANDIAFNPAGDKLAVAFDGSPYVRLYDWSYSGGFDGGALLVDALDNNANGIAWSTDGNHFGVTTDDHMVNLYTYPARTRIYEYPTVPSFQGNKIAFTSNDEE